MIYLYCLALAVNEQIFNPTGTTTYEGKVEIETQPLTSEIKFRKCSD